MLTSPGNLFFNGVNAASANFGLPVELFSPVQYLPGSSYNHLDDGTFDGTPNALMTHSIAFGEVAHDPGPVVLGLLQDLGWQLNPIISQSPAVSSPLAGAVLGSPSESFSWSANSTAVDEWWIYAGSKLGGRNYYDSGNLFAGLSTTVSGLPNDGSTVYVRLWYRQAGGAWSFVDTIYTSG